MARSVLSGGVRRRSWRGRWPLILLLVILGAVGIGVGLSSGNRGGAKTGRSSASGAVSASTHRTRGRRARHARTAHPGPAAPPSARRAAAAAAPEIVRVLRTSRFVTGGARRRRVAALTFDDGPSPYTPGIVRTLVRLHVPATFFVVGQQLRYFTDGLRDELRHGFLIGDHTVNHSALPRLGLPGQLHQVGDDARMLEAAGAPAVRMFRPPYGLANGVTFSVLRRLHMLMVLWSVDPGDWRRPGAKAIVANVLHAVHPGSIVILHDGGGDRTQTNAALPELVRRLRRNHYRLVSVPELLRIDPPPRHQRVPTLTGA